jgi:hypothetical protein
LAAPRLTINILTRESEERLGHLVAQLSPLADQILIGVDAASTDRTLEIAATLADVVYRFRHQGQLAPARLLPFNYASGDWILSIDDDEGIESSFETILPSLLSDSRATHYWFPRKWVVSLDPCEYAYSAPWFPDWQLRLFRNDRSLVWKPPQVHSGYHVQGPGQFESRACLLHFEPLVCSGSARQAKIDRYRRMGCIEEGQAVFASAANAPRRLADPQRPRSDTRTRAGIIHHDIHELTTPPYPPWRSTVAEVDLPAATRAGAPLTAQVTAINTGELAWTPPTLDRWPMVQVGIHILDSSGAALDWNGPRWPIPRFVAPGDRVTFICQFAAPATPGCYLLEWDLVSEGECWFANCGGETLRSELNVEP